MASRYLKARSFKFVEGDGAGNHVKNTAAFADVAAAYVAVLAAEVDDMIEMSFDGAYFVSAAGQGQKFTFSVNGVDMGGTLGVSYETAAASNTTYGFHARYYRKIVAGDLSAGFVTVRPRYAPDGTHTFNIHNNANLKPIFFAMNIGPADPN